MKRWHERNTLTVKDVVESMVQWQQGRCLDLRVWNRLRPRLNPRLMPAPSVIQPKCSLKRKLEDVELEDSVRIFTCHLVVKFANVGNAEKGHQK